MLLVQKIQEGLSTDDQRIVEEVESLAVVMTSTDHNSGTERCIEIANNYEDFDILINIQGDEPLVEARQLNN